MLSFLNLELGKETMFLSVWAVGSSILPQCRSALLLVYQQQVFLYSVKEELAVDAHLEMRI